jgi:hypothetical protein
MAQSNEDTSQETFGSVHVNEYNDTHGIRTCDMPKGYGENGEPERCQNNASIVIFREYQGIAEFYCKVCAKDEWVRMAEECPEQ